jgi:hypothetical protein
MLSFSEDRLCVPFEPEFRTVRRRGVVLRSTGATISRPTIDDPGSRRQERAVTTHASPVYAAVHHILTAPVLAGRCAPYLHASDVDWDGLLAQTHAMSSAQVTLVRVAHDLWDGRHQVSLWELPTRLGPSSFDRVIQAMHLYREEPVPDAA